MKINFHWGWGISIAIALFMISFSTLVVSAIRQNVELVAPDYYDQEVRYQARIDQIANARALDNPVRISQPAPSTVLLAYTADVQGATGQIAFFRPSDAKLDFVVDMQTGDTAQQIRDTHLIRGLWRIKITWEKAGKAYYHEQPLVIQ